MTVPALAVQLPGVGSVSADNLNTYLQGTLLATDLRNFPALSAMQVAVAGSAAVGDGGAGVFYYDSSSTASDNGTTVIVPFGNIQGAWLRSGYLFPEIDTDTWVAYPAVITITGGSGTSTGGVSFSYQTYGKTLLIRGQFIVNYSSTPTGVSITLPSGFTAVTGVSQGVSSSNESTTTPLVGTIQGSSNLLQIYGTSLAFPCTATGQVLHVNGFIQVN